MSELPYRFESAPKFSVLSLEPGLNNVQWADVERVGSDVLSKISELRPPAMIVDLSALDYMGSAMVALIVRVWKAVKEVGGRMVVVNRHPTTLEVLKLAGLVKIWTVVDSREAAYAHLNVRPSSGTPAVADGTSAASSRLLIALAVLLLAAAGAGLASRFTSPQWLGERIATVATFLGGALALMAGTAIGVRGAGGRRIVGILVVVASLAVIVAGVVNLPSMNRAAPPPATPAAEADTGR